MAELASANGIPAGAAHINPQIQPSQVTITEGGLQAPVFTDDAAATIVVSNYEKAKQYLETNSWLLEWQAADILYQSPVNDRWVRVADGRPVRISRFLVAKNTVTMAGQVHRGVWGNQKPFALQPEGETTELHLTAWTHLLWVLLKRSRAEYHFGLANDSAALYGTGVLRPGCETKTVIKKVRKRKKPETEINLPLGGAEKVPTEESDDFAIVPMEVKETWPFIEYMRLGTALFDPEWRTPNAPEESARYVIDYEVVDFQGLQRLRELPCYKNIPDDETLKAWFLNHPQGDAAPASQTADLMTSQSSVVAHAEGEQRQMSADPFKKPYPLISMWDCEHVTTVWCVDGRYMVIRNDEHDIGDHALHYTMNWWNIPNMGYGLGIGRLNSGDQRMEQGVLNEVLKMIGMWFNTPLLTRRGLNAPTQNVIAGLGTFLAVDTAPGEHVKDAVAYIDKPAIPREAWQVYQEAKEGGQDLVGANATTMQGNLGGPGSSAMRTAAGVNRVGGKADENVAGPVEQQGNALERFLYFLIDIVRLKMPPSEIRQILRKKYAQAILDQLDMEKFLNAEFSVNVLAGMRLMARQAIQQLIPFLLQIIQQPQALDALHQTGRTIDFAAIESLFIRMSELDGNADNIYRPMTKEELATYKQNSPGAQKAAAQVAVQKQRGQDKLQEVQVKGQVDQTNKITEIAAEHMAGAIPLERAEGLVSRDQDEQILRNGIPGIG
jgi:hypothetical protein